MLNANSEASLDNGPITQRSVERMIPKMHMDVIFVDYMLLLYQKVLG